ncbi:MAG TPA: hypothetical protein VG345_11620, partial [Bryobacteraceae bacterium]|nr:hypothetical protein [Bryobacteraceae bacterium]
MRTLIPALLFASAAFGSIAPADFVPVRWTSSDPRSLDLIAGTSVNCLLLEWKADRAQSFSAFASAAEPKGVAVLAVLHPGADPVPAAHQAVNAHAGGIVLDGDFPSGTAARVRDALADRKTLVVEIAKRNRLNFASGAPILATDQGVWPGIQIEPEGAAHAGPSAAAWIDTNAGFLEAANAMANGATVWIAVRPPDKNTFKSDRYLQAVGDAALTGSRWVVAFDPDTQAAIDRGDAGALKTWKSVADLLTWFEKHPDWRKLPAGGKLAIVQDPKHGALMSGGILDMIATRHTPIRVETPDQLTPSALSGTTMALNTEPESLTPAQQQTLLEWRRKGGTLLTAPAGWRDSLPPDLTDAKLSDEQVKRLDDMWRDVSTMIGRR